MMTTLNQDDLSEVASELLATPLDDSIDLEHEQDFDNLEANEKIDKLNDVRQRLHELRTIVSDYEVIRPCRI